MSDFSSQNYWETRYKNGGTSGLGSQGDLLEFKAKVINDFITSMGICSVIDLGCGDGQLTAKIICDVYMGYDVSPTALSKCRRACLPGKHFYMLDQYKGEAADMAMSMDVIFHLVEDEVFHQYMRTLFFAADHYVIIYSSNHSDNKGMANHVRHRKFTDWIADNRPDWKLIGQTKNKFSFDEGDPNGSFCDFYFYQKREGKK